MIIDFQALGMPPDFPLPPGMPTDVPYPEVYIKRVIYPNPNGEGGVIITSPSPECDSVERMINKIPEGLPYEVINMWDLPADRTYRDAWTFEEG